MTAVAYPIPEAALALHMAIVGMTGSGKTSTAKLAVEQIVAEGGRVCILDPIKSDWWGLISSADGSRPGLPFHVLGGPHGHAPITSSAGGAVAGLVAHGTLPLTIVDMALFEPGGLQRFFNDFAPTLLQRMRGVVYLVVEEAHLFAPKERSGIGAETHAIHWAKTLATAGRSKGIRLILATQRTQALHNALLGSCETLIAHRLTAPADQAPVDKWLKANATKEVYGEVAGSLAALPTGTGWLVCSGAAALVERIAFPRIATFDNSATPTGAIEDRSVRTTKVDMAELKRVLSAAVTEAEASDPAALRARIVELEARSASAAPIVQRDSAAAEIAAAERRGYERGLADGNVSGRVGAFRHAAVALQGLAETLLTGIDDGDEPVPEVQPAAAMTTPPKQSRRRTASTEVGCGDLSQGERTLVAALDVKEPYAIGWPAVAIRAGYVATGGGFLSARKALLARGIVEQQGEKVSLVRMKALAAPPSQESLIALWTARLPSGAGRLLLALANGPLAKKHLATMTGYVVSGGGFLSAAKKLRTSGLVAVEGDTYRLSDAFREACGDTP